ncbi:MAG: 30S ribosomal protein S15 [Candidatus Marinimicrobia bacterium]|jgi:small subunit ribosomal protein S15|nr:30S ribosomal protein S15 [Candidatus Neomarinimicrobiota bacterium]MBT3936291.1 30S ribosomal protein S15 [Candidatus Neomarinimicrobiota bacterium]MBT3961340.1 30S ribosomal protein S15 [Candidatus Neomarinimicrobiota bacterium]MBT4382940.1 30S ribosomal protein S15 [Candidatus Neomarinimicrobiota bacterium]MBT4637108.1 30S ribosomal protein S15 [Candidatus Neomarinimicrobiota bacterium]
MSLTQAEITEIIKQFGKDENDSGSAEVQIALFTKRIRQLTEHAKVHKKDHHTKRGLVQLVSQRKKMLKYLIKTDAESYMKVIKELQIRG